MSFEQFVKENIFAERLADSGVLVVYDPSERYRDICLAMAGDHCQVVNATEGSILARERALAIFLELAEADTPTQQLLIYVPAEAPRTDEAKQVDPFSIFGVCGGVFPEGAGDEYQQLCLRHKPNYSTELRTLFEREPNPSFAMINGIGAGSGWPILEERLQKNSATELLLALMAPDDDQLARLKDDSTWVSEANALVESALGIALRTRAKTWKPISEELWSHVLFSEFYFDLPQALPESLAQVPCAVETAKPIVYDLCKSLRNDRTRRDLYIERAREVQVRYELDRHCAGVEDLGERDTFPFEERVFLNAAVSAIRDGDLDRARVIARRHSDSVWASVGESQAQWNLARAALDLVAACEDLGRELAGSAKNLEALIGFYVSRLREVDRRQREFEQTVSASLEIQDELSEVIHFARQHYAKLAAKAQHLFSKLLEAEGWPPTGLLRNADVFDRFVGPVLETRGRRIAYIMVDALRFELGEALRSQLSDDDETTIEPAAANFPTITRVGMASLLPNAGQALRLVRKNDGLSAVLGDDEVVTVPQRMKVFQRLFGDRFEEMWVKDFVKRSEPIADHVDLLVLRSVLIDQLFENDPESAFSQVQQILNRIRVAINKLRKQGFEQVIIATDHGFYLNNHAEAGDVCAKPRGTWLNLHERAMLGDGSADDHSFVLDCEKAGVKGEFKQIASPRTMAPYRKGLHYFHGGLSLQETIVPVITVRLRAEEQAAVAKASVALSFKDGKTRITTRLPVVDVRVESDDIFSTSHTFEILLEAHNKDGEVVGEARPGGQVNAATGTLSLKPGETARVAIRMLEDFEGKFTVKALDPNTLTEYSQIQLATNYLD